MDYLGIIILLVFIFMGLAILYKINVILENQEEIKSRLDKISKDAQSSGSEIN